MKSTSAANLRQRGRHRPWYMAALLCGCAALPPGDPASRASGPVLTGLDVVLRDNGGVLAGKRVGLITNHTGRTQFAGAKGELGIDALHRHPRVQLVALFSPEHSITGRADAGERVESGREPRTGLPIHSLYGAIRKPTPEMLRDIDALVFDIQDIGTRYYTYVWTMALALQAAAEHNKEFIVLDRPNPIGGELVHGNVLDPAFATFVGLYPVPMRHGMTPGELARYVNTEHGVNARLTVVPLEGWRRDMWFEQTGLEWVAPSPNMPSVESAAHYPGTCLFEGTNLSVGRGTPSAFQIIGAPWLDADRVVARLQQYALPGVRFEVVTFTPQAPGDNKFNGVLLRGIRFVTTDRSSYDPAHAGIAALVEIQREHPQQLTFRVAHFDRLAGTNRVREMLLASESLERITLSWNAQLAVFNNARAKYLLYH